MKKYADLVVVAVVLALVPVLAGGSPYYMRLATLALVYMAWTVAFNLIFGHTKQLFLCLGALAGSAAYMTVVFTKQLELSPWITVPIGVATAAGLGALFSYVSVLRGLGIIFLGIVTLAFSLIFHNLVLGLRQFTNGETGLVSRGLGFPLLEQPMSSYYIFLGVLLVALIVYYLLMASRMGMAVRALSDDELTAELSGINVTWYKVLAAAVASAILGLAGSLYAFYNGIVSPSVFSFVSVDIPVLIALLLGGMRTRLGPIIGAAAFAVIEELVRPFGQLNVLVYGVLLIVLFVAFREGLVPMLRKTLKLSLP
ncbi:MAG: branched-chain amino acid ABC transporter permease [Betaproteobacteria bacterium]|nr:MAG: branched-chain amino acid ABC transporter permease [Betaproteobacteria bacterium]